MINSNELRLGNYVGIPDCAIQVPIKVIGKTHVVVDNSSVDLDNDMCVFEYSSLSPIHLTPAILEKAGFILVNSISLKWKKYTNDSDSESIILQLSEVGNAKPYRVEYSYNDDVALKRKIHYLHELQNVYHAITSQELPITL